MIENGTEAGEAVARAAAAFQEVGGCGPRAANFVE